MYHGQNEASKHPPNPHVSLQSLALCNCIKWHKSSHLFSTKFLDKVDSRKLMKSSKLSCFHHHFLILPCQIHHLVPSFLSLSNVAEQNMSSVVSSEATHSAALSASIHNNPPEVRHRLVFVVIAALFIWWNHHHWKGLAWCNHHWKGLVWFNCQWRGHVQCHCCWRGLVQWSHCWWRGLAWWCNNHWRGLVWWRQCWWWRELFIGEAASYLGFFCLSCDGLTMIMKISWNRWFLACKCSPVSIFFSGNVTRRGQRHAASGHLLLPYYLTFPSISPILLQKQRKRKYGRNQLWKTTTSPNNCMTAKYNHFSKIKRCNYQSLKCNFFNWPTINLTLLWVIAKIYLIHLKVACL